ncbi:MAG: DUF11 domain-containing protein [Thiothrix sp.]|nr:DUF11 domain-containing protein [Thiothrix sp.]HPE61498.1 hypothetical protein [Thiolinea sp.]
MFPKIHLFKKRDYAYLMLAASIIAGGFAIANSQARTAPLQNTLQAYLVGVDQQGREILQPTREVEPGQLIEYQLTYSNTGSSALKDVVVTGPIPAATAYMPQSARSQARAQLQVSVDNGKTFESEPVKRMITDKNGRKVEVIIPPSEYSHVRWTMKEPLQAGVTQQFAYRSIVE